MKKILAVDDENSVLEVLKDVLTDRGYDVTTTTNPDEALRKLQAEPVDLVLLDVVMPGKNGFTLCKELGSHRKVPVLFVSGCPKMFAPESEEFSDIWSTQFSLGCTDVLYKPFTLDRLYEKVESLIGSPEVASHGGSK